MRPMRDVLVAAISLATVLAVVARPHPFQDGPIGGVDLRNVISKASAKVQQVGLEAKSALASSTASARRSLQPEQRKTQTQVFARAKKLSEVSQTAPQRWFEKVVANLPDVSTILAHDGVSRRMSQPQLFQSDFRRASHSNASNTTDTDTNSTDSMDDDEDGDESEYTYNYNFSFSDDEPFTPCTALQELEWPPSNTQLENVCEDGCCNYLDSLAAVGGVDPLEVKDTLCAKQSANAYCWANWPTFTGNDATDMTTVCSSTCKASWLGTGALAGSSLLRRGGHCGNDVSIVALADWLCTTDTNNEYCLLNIVGESDANDDMVTDAGLATLCGGCADFYFNNPDPSAEGMEFAQDLLCAKDANQNWCFTTFPNISAGPTNANLQAICNSDCTEAWLTALFLDDGDADDIPTNFVSTFCSQDSNNNYCAAQEIDFDSLSFPFSAQNLTAICSSECKGFYLELLSQTGFADMDFSAAELDTWLCSMDGNQFCQADSAMPNLLAVVGDPSTIGTLCASPCRNSWVVSALIMIASDDSRRAGHVMSMGSMIEDVAGSFCAQVDGSYCITQLFSGGLEEEDDDDDDDEDSLPTSADLDLLCGNANAGSCAGHVGRIIGIIFGSPLRRGGHDCDDDDDTPLNLLCARKPSGEYCYLSLLTEFMGADGGEDSEAPPDFSGALLELMCGDCFSGPGVANQILGDDDFISKLICSRDSSGYCLAQPSVVALLDGESDFFDILFGDKAAAATEVSAAATQFCENTCLNLLVNLGVSAELGGLSLECLPPAQQWGFKLLKAGCYQNAGEYCISTISQSTAAGDLVNAACSIASDWTWPGTCTAGSACATRTGELFSGWGCCLTELELPITAPLSTACGVAAPGSCEFAGEFTVVIVISNLRYAWLQTRLQDGVIRTAIATDVGGAVNIGQSLVTIVSAIASGSGTELTLKIVVPSAAMARAVAKRLRGNGRRAVSLNVPMNSLDAAIPASERTAALVDPTASLEGGVQEESITATGTVASEALAAETPDPPSVPAGAASTAPMMAASVGVALLLSLRAALP